MFQSIPRFQAGTHEPGAARRRAGDLLAAVANVVSRGRTSVLLLIMWLLILPVSGVLASMLYGIANNDASSYLPRSAESTQVYSILAQ